MTAAPNDAELQAWLEESLNAGQAVLAREAVPASIPDTLYHYTRPGGLEGMISGQRLWASHAWFLNDPTEVEYGHRIVQERLPTMLQIDRGELTQELVARVAAAWSQRDRYIDIFVTCFSARGDLASQWDRYAPNGGASLGFATFDIPEVHMGIRQVLYEPDDQRVAINKVLAIHSQTLHACRSRFGAARAREAIPRIADSLLGGLAFQSVTIKMQDWSPEEEWRLVVWQMCASQASPSTSRTPVKFRVASQQSLQYLIPFIEVDGRAVAGKFAGRLPIRDVYLGHTEDVDLTVNGLTRLLAENGYSSDTSTIRCSHSASAENGGQILDW